MKREYETIAVIGSGPAALMAADVLAGAGRDVCLFEKRSGLAWKLYVAGSSGLNISNSLPLPAFAAQYSGPPGFWESCLGDFPPSAWLRFIENDLGEGTFLGTSGRYFVETMHAAKLIRSWKRRLEEKGVRLRVGQDCSDFKAAPEGWRLSFRDHPDESFDALLFALGGASYESGGLAWPEFFGKKGIRVQPFEASNAGYELAWSAAFLREAEGQALKNIRLSTSRGERRGDLVVTSYGLEGTPIYTLGIPGPAQLDLKPDLTADEIRQKLERSKERLSPLRRVKKYLQLCPASQALLFHHAPDASKADLESLIAVVKNFPLDLLKARPLSESISSKGGVAWENLDSSLMLRNFPGVYLAGEMIDWDAPTGGFLIQGAVSQGFRAACSLLEVSQKASMR